ncbi:hypothetical protein [Tetragenococcus halophilus]|uniref:hypothetical protein n=1 Tax=Tetragenococcus halophilus TaxID=51669 RepID=UPI00300FFA63
MIKMLSEEEYQDLIEELEEKKDELLVIMDRPGYDEDAMYSENHPNNALQFQQEELQEEIQELEDKVYSVSY